MRLGENEREGVRMDGTAEAMYTTFRDFMKKIAAGMKFPLPRADISANDMLRIFRDELTEKVRLDIANAKRKAALKVAEQSKVAVTKLAAEVETFKDGVYEQLAEQGIILPGSGAVVAPVQSPIVQPPGGPVNSVADPLPSTPPQYYAPSTPAIVDPVESAVVTHFSNSDSSLEPAPASASPVVATGTADIPQGAVIPGQPVENGPALAPASPWKKVLPWAASIAVMLILRG